MKVITEESLQQKLNGMHSYKDDYALIKELIDECQEIDTLTVNKLRPMSDAPKFGEFLVMLNTEDELHECSFALDGRIRIGAMLFSIDYCIGWIPKPSYNKELKG